MRYATAGHLVEEASKIEVGPDKSFLSRNVSGSAAALERQKKSNLELRKNPLYDGTNLKTVRWDSPGTKPG